ncbi:MAG: hypothetical protein K2V38_24495, partial [Gemmataceae bacterium]|nr:hypothetical protein [Gemmataceae bacterium]
MRGPESARTPWVLGAVAFVLAAAGALPYAGGYNDGGRLATAECLAERGTLRIDDSVFVRPPPELVAAGRPPYSRGVDSVNAHGTLDKVFVGGHFYSDKPPIPAVLLAAAYRALMALGLPPPSTRPDVFCWVAAVLTGAVPFAVTVGLMWQLGRRAGLGPRWRVVWLGGFALATMLPAYTRQVNA